MLVWIHLEETRKEPEIPISWIPNECPLAQFGFPNSEMLVSLVCLFPGDRGEDLTQGLGSARPQPHTVL